MNGIHPFLSILVHWFLKCLCSFLPSPVWPLPICLDSWTWHSRFLSNITLYSIGPCFYHQSHPQLGIIFVWLHPFILFGVISLLISKSILGTYQPGEFIFQYTIFFAFSCFFLGFSCFLWGSQGKKLKWFAIPFSTGPRFVRTLHHNPSVLGGPTQHVS